MLTINELSPSVNPINQVKNSLEGSDFLSPKKDLYLTLNKEKLKPLLVCLVLACSNPIDDWKDIMGKKYNNIAQFTSRV